ncbi:MAG TPA: TonB-dependent receptor [Pyrinomonadaceae bacterium]|jgi:hypothetical protein
MRNSKLYLYAILIVLLTLSPSSQAQTNAGFIRGTVTDPNGATVSDAVVRLTNPLTNYTQTAETRSDGSYQLVDVPFNRYTLTVEAKGFEVSTQDVTVQSDLVQHVDVRLGVAPVRQAVTVGAANDLLDVNKTAPSTVIDRTRILTFATSQPSRSTEEIVATAPGWTLDANHRLHARGIEYQVQYSIDGIPITDTIASTFAASPDPRNFRSVEVTTANIPAEYGNKLAGLIAVTSRSGLELPTSGSLTFTGGSFNTYEGSFDLGGHTPHFGYFMSGAVSRTDRFLDPPAIENFHNRGTSGRSFFKFDYAPDQKNLLRLNLSFDRDRFQVPNLPDQQEEGQDQRRKTKDHMESFSWQHIFSPHAVSFLAFSQRYNSARLDSNEFTGPVFAEQTRHNSTYDLLGSLTYSAKGHTIKAGFDYLHFPVTESFTFAITDLDELLEIEPDLTEDAQEFTLANPFFFRDHRTGNEGSFYVQDHFNATRHLTLDLGARFDSYHFLVTQNFLSPRLGLAYLVEKTGTVLRASFSRFMETPALENLLLSSSARTRIFSPAEEEDEPTFAPVRPSKETQFDIGFQQQMGRYLRLDSEFYYRRIKNQPEIINFLETGIIFPATLDRNRSKGIENRLDLARIRGFSGFVSYTNFHIYGFAPITGGLFLGEAVDTLSRSGEKINIEEDQRNTVAFEARYDRLPQHFWVVFSGRHDSGYSVELEPDADSEEFAEEFPEEILEQVNLERGFVKPHTVLNLAVGKEFNLSEHVSLVGQFNVENFTNKFYLTTFESVFSGTAIGRPRSFSGRLSIDFK